MSKARFCRYQSTRRGKIGGVTPNKGGTTHLGLPVFDGRDYGAPFASGSSAPSAAARATTGATPSRAISG